MANAPYSARPIGLKFSEKFRHRQICAPLQRHILLNESNKAHSATDRTQEQIMTKRRWLKSIITASQEQQPAMPFQRGNRTKRAALATAAKAVSAPRAAAAR